MDPVRHGCHRSLAGSLKQLLKYQLVFCDLTFGERAQPLSLTLPHSPSLSLTPPSLSLTLPHSPSLSRLCAYVSKMPPALLSFALLAGTALAQQQALWGQCGGIGWTGPTNCVGGSCCSTQNSWYAQCTPGSGCPGGGSGPTTTTTMSTRISTTSTAQITTTGGPITPASLQQVSGFGNNPTGTQMYIYVPNRLATNPGIVVAVSCRFRVDSAWYEWAKC